MQAGRAGIPCSQHRRAVVGTRADPQRLQVRPEIGYYRNDNNPAFDNGRRKDMLLAGFDVTLRF